MKNNIENENENTKLVWPPLAAKYPPRDPTIPHWLQ